MAEEGGFLARWSRRKREVTQPGEPVAAEPTTGLEAGSHDGSVAMPATGAPVVTSEEESFDLSTLPSIDELTAESDIRDFLHKGVPEPLRNAALRKVWAADPFLRTFTGPGEYAWDFNDPDSIPGFSSAPPEFDLVEHARQVMGHGSPMPERQHGSDMTPEGVQILSPGEAPEAIEPVASKTQTLLPEAQTEDAAARYPRGEQGEAAENGADQEQFQNVQKRRRHGGAVPD